MFPPQQWREDAPLSFADYPALRKDPWQEVHILAERAGVSSGRLCLVVEEATRFAREQKTVAAFDQWNSPYNDLEEVIRTLAASDDFESKSDWNEWEHPRDELGRFAHGGIHGAARGERYNTPIEGNSAFWDGGGAHRDATTRQHFNGKFRVGIFPNEQGTIDHISHQLFGRALEPHEWGELIGAPDGEKLEARPLARSILIQIQPDTPSPMFISLMREAYPGDAHGVKQHITAHLIDSVINKQGDAPKDLAPRMLAYSIRKCQELGIETIVSHAEGNRHTTRTIGYKHWPRMGFNADLNASDRVNLARISPRLRNANSILDLYEMEGGPEAWAKVGTGRKMFLNTSPNSQSQKVFAAYLKQKGIEP